MIELYTDGGCINNPGEGAIGVVLKYKQHVKRISYYVPYTTNNQMELMAVVVGLSSIKLHMPVQLYADSQYVIKGLDWMSAWQNNNWRGKNNKPIKNPALWKRINELIAQHDVTYNWVKGHADNDCNNEADSLATECIKAKQPLLPDEFAQLLPPRK